MAILNMNAHTYKKYISETAKPVLVEFSAPWCGYCRRLAPALELTAQQYEDEILFGEINIDDDPVLAEEEQIELVPTLLLYQNGQLLGSIVAPESRAQLEEFIDGSLGRGSGEQTEEKHIYDMLVIGGGPGGYTSALYAARAGLDTIVLEKLSAGGQMALTEQIDNYPGFENGIDGFSLGEKMRKGTERFGVETRLVEVLSLDLSGEIKKAETSEGPVYGRTVVLSTGATPRELGVAGEKELIGKGVAYCAACDGMFYKDKTVVLVGGGNSAAAEALILARVCKKVILVHRRDTLRATKIYHEPLMKTENVEFRWNNTVAELLHDGKVTGVRLRDVTTGAESEIACDGVFVSIGRKPATELVAGQLELDESGYVVADETTETNIPGVYAVGDVRTKLVRQVVTAVADGAVAVHMAEEYLAGGTT